ncbi:sensor histidine kinase [Hyphomicrobium methylovorum]|uniref:sensor histidine kinase n=1 Tax=Hyphomicrobium methylovorum TaxID=84 RepID=UPI0015E789AA|nr:HAMP domain-containing sensor histidine kinase [Hyphomicrobium methylovorum]MBA2125440.1 sensor histidine kinase [Hyphomicrobium methylovorum]
MSFRSLRLRLLLAGALSVFIALGLAAFGLTVLFKQHVEQRVDAELNVYLNQLAANLAVAPNGQLIVERPPADPRFDEPLSGLYWQIAIDSGGKELRSRSLWDSSLSLPTELNVDDAIHHHLIAGPDGAKVYLLQRNIELPARLGGSKARIAVAWNAAEVQTSVRSFASELLPFLLLIGGLLLVASWAQVTVGLRPLAAIRKKLTAIRSGSERRLEAGFPDEVQPLADEIDALLNERELAIEKAKGRAADLAHGLKTPLQVLHGETERLKAKGETEIAADISSLAETMRRNVDRELARARLAYAARNASANVKVAVDRVVRVVERTPSGQKLDWVIDVPKDLAARIHVDDLAEALGNVIENAARHARGQISITAGANDRDTTIAIADDGPGIAEELQGEVIVRGARLDTRSEGAGLGLAIVSDIADAWGGSMGLKNGGSGLIVTLRFPSSARKKNSATPDAV